jgi:hypothetical protein
MASQPVHEDDFDGDYSVEGEPEEGGSGATVSGSIVAWQNAIY